MGTHPRHRDQHCCPPNGTPLRHRYQHWACPYGHPAVPAGPSLLPPSGTQQPLTPVTSIAARPPMAHPLGNANLLPPMAHPQATVTEQLAAPPNGPSPLSHRDQHCCAPWHNPSAANRDQQLLGPRMAPPRARVTSNCWLPPTWHNPSAVTINCCPHGPHPSQHPP
eukprot:gene14997-21056_t